MYVHLALYISHGTWVQYANLYVLFFLLGVYEIDGNEYINVLVILVPVFTGVHDTSLYLFRHIHVNQIRRSSCLHVFSRFTNICVFPGLCHIVDRLFVYGQHIFPER